jgi:hypothetical protein
MKRHIVYLAIKGIKIIMNTLLRANHYDLLCPAIQNCSIMLDKYIYKYQKLTFNPALRTFSIHNEVLLWDPSQPPF